ncbi:hypothetical protein SGRA_1887 [Saprospira grandis str. Lewin]|uniref:Uncharacterized protein n=1 Tax=Saprospira grandis (strain Lewin) TaxID=984262 RepID=H6L1H7_SAPGL|nr:hypothetical protein SGRA_1887 [Saprospira grandis str. Lewin]
MSVAKKLQGRADLRATTQPDPSEAQGQPQKKYKTEL